MPWRLATCQMVSPSRATVSLPSSRNFTVLPWPLALPSTLSAGALCATPGLPACLFSPPATPFLSWPYPAGLVLSSMASPGAERLAQLFGKIFRDAGQRIGGRLTQAANRGVPHRGGEFVQQALVPRTLRHELDGFLGTNAAWRALAAALIFKEFHQVESHSFHIVLIRQDHNGVGADETAIFFKGSEVERQIGHRCW